MGVSIKKRGQKMLRRFSKASIQVSEDSREHIKENVIERVSHIQNIKLLIFEWSLLTLGLIMLAVTQAFWSSSSYATDVFVEGGTYTEATIGRINSMNPLFATTGSEKILSKLMFATLSAPDTSGKPSLMLAKSLTPTENGKIWTMELKDNLKWSDGEPITDEDVLFTIGLIQNPSINTIYTSNLENVKVSKSEDGKIIFTLPSAYADFKSALEIPIVPKHVLEDTSPKNLIEADFSNAPVTSGAFKFNALQTSTNADEEVVYLAANPNYYLGRPMLNTFAVHTFSSKDDVANALNAGSVTATAELNGLDAEKITSGAFEKRETSINAGAFIFFNTTSHFLKNQDLRATIREGINLSTLREKAPNTQSLDFPLIESQIKLTEYPELITENFLDATTKIEEMEESEPISLEIATVDSGYLPKVAEELKNQLVMLGIDTKLMIYEETQDFIVNVIAKRNYDILVYEVELGAEPDLLPYYHSSQTKAAGLNLSNYSNALADDLIIGARETLDGALRTKKYESFLDYWYNDIPSIGLYLANTTYIYNKNVRTYGDNNKLVTAMNRFSDIENWAATKATRNLTP